MSTELADLGKRLVLAAKAAAAMHLEAHAAAIGRQLDAPQPSAARREVTGNPLEGEP